MRLIPRNRHRNRNLETRIAISEAEISADLHYPATRREPQRSAHARRLEAR